MYKVILGIEDIRDGRSVLGQEHTISASSIAGAAKKAIKAAGRERLVTQVTIRAPSGREVHGVWGPDVTQDTLEKAWGLVQVYARNACNACERDTCEGCSEPDERPSRALTYAAWAGMAIRDGRLEDAERFADAAFQAGGESDYWQGFRDRATWLIAGVPYVFKEVL